MLRTTVFAAVLALFLTPAASPAEVYFGDPHAHSTFSDPDSVGDHTPEDFFRLARDVVGLDFAALSDHDAFLTENEWEINKSTTASFNVPGEFIAFPAVEWTHKWHMNVYFEHDEQPICDSPTLKCPEAHEFYEFWKPVFEADEAASQVNHPAGIFAVDWRGVDDTLTTNVEMFNVAASGSGSEELGFGAVLWALRAGYRVGFVGVSDDHRTDAPDPLIGRGLTGCHAEALTRHDLIESFQNRRCYPTTGERILVEMDVDGTLMGGEIHARVGSRLPVDVRLTGTAGPIQIELVQGGKVVKRRRCHDRECGLAGEVVVRDPSDFVYARIFQGDDHRAWSSPVWLRGECAGGYGCLASRVASGNDGGDDCLAEWLFPRGASSSVYRRAANRIECRDGDPRCDLDDETGQCTVALGICFGGTTTPRATCAPGDVDSWNVVLPADGAAVRTPAYETRRTLESIHHAAHTASDKASCSPLSTFRVDVGRQSIEVEAQSGERIDRDTLTIDCRPAGATRRKLAIRPHR